MDENEGRSGGNYIEQSCPNVFSEEEGDCRGDLCTDGNVDEDFIKPLDLNIEEVWFKNEEETEKKSMDEVSQSMHQPRDVTGGGENNDNVEANSNGEFIVNEMEGRFVEVVVGEFAIESKQLSGGAGEVENVALINRNEPNRKTEKESPGKGGLIESLENVRSSNNDEGDRIGGRGINRHDEHVSNQGINGTPPVLHSESGTIMDHGPVLGIPVVQMDSHGGVLGAPMPPFNQSLIPFDNIGLPLAAPYVNPTYFMPRSSAHVHTMGMFPHPGILGTPAILHSQTVMVQHYGLPFGTHMFQMGSYMVLPSGPNPSFPSFSIIGFPPITPFNPPFFMLRSSAHEYNTRVLPGPNVPGRSHDQRHRRIREVNDRDRAMFHDQRRQVGTNRGQEKATKEKTKKSKARSNRKTRDDEKHNSDRNTPQQKGTGAEKDGSERHHNERDDGRDQETGQDPEPPKDLEWEYDWV